MTISGKTLMMTTLVGAMIALPSVSNAQGLWHRIMRGTIVANDNGAITVCVGRSDGAKIGQELLVTRVTNTGIGVKGSTAWRLQNIGRIRLTEVFDEHFAQATVISGSPSKNDLVELRAEGPRP